VTCSWRWGEDATDRGVGFGVSACQHAVKEGRLSGLAATALCAADRHHFLPEHVGRVAIGPRGDIRGAERWPDRAVGLAAAQLSRRLCERPVSMSGPSSPNRIAEWARCNGLWKWYWARGLAGKSGARASGATMRFESRIRGEMRAYDVRVEARWAAEAVM